MARTFPFRAFRYTAKAGAAERLVTQPYDKITSQMQERYYSFSPYNFARLTKGRELPSDDETDNVYTRASADLDSWIAEGILEQDAEPTFYPYFQSFRHPETGEEFVRKGFIGLTQVVDYDANVVHRHELTHSGPKLDRLQLTRHTRAHFGQLFMLYDDRESAIDQSLDEVASGPPLLSVEDEHGVLHRLWKISDPTMVAAIQSQMDDKKLLIADGHHRYETALAYARENPGLRGADRVMMTFVNLRAPGLVVLATHRVLAGLADFDAEAFLQKAREGFAVEALASSAELREKLAAVPSGTNAIGLAVGGDSRIYLLTAKRETLERRLADLPEQSRHLDVVVLHRLLIGEMLGLSEEDVRELKSIRYVRGFEAAAEEVRSGAAQVAFLLRPVRPEQVAEVAFAGGVMPQKSTDFYPKLLAGLTVYRMG